MCAGDLAMEPHDPSDADDNGPLDGSWNGHHGKCPAYQWQQQPGPIRKEDGGLTAFSLRSVQGLRRDYSLLGK